jgi:hypothetical protein
VKGALVEGRFRRALLQLAAVTGVGVAAGVGAQGAARAGLLWGVGLAAVSSVVALFFKRRAVQKGLKAAMAAMVWVLGVRMVCVVAGVLLLSKTWQEGVAWFVAGFFVAYLAAQVIEVRYVLSESSSDSARSE